MEKLWCCLKEPWTWHKSPEISSWFFDLTLCQSLSQDWFVHLQNGGNDRILAHCVKEIDLTIWKLLLRDWDRQEFMRKPTCSLIRTAPCFSRQRRRRGTLPWMSGLVANSCTPICYPPHVALLFSPWGRLAIAQLRPRWTFNKTLLQFRDGLGN